MYFGKYFGAAVPAAPPPAIPPPPATPPTTQPGAEGAFRFYGEPRVWSNTPAGMISRLDDSLARCGENVVLRKVTGTTNQASVDVGVRAHITGVRAEELTEGISQNHDKLILSPTEITRAQWPGGVAPSFIGDPRIPLKDYKAVIRGKARNIDFVKPLIRRGELVRIELFVAG